MTKRTYTMTVEIDVEDHPDARIPEIKEYVHAAVRGWGGAYRPDDPFFGLSAEDVRVVHVGRKAR